MARTPLLRESFGTAEKALTIKKRLICGVLRPFLTRKRLGALSVSLGEP